MNIHQYKHQYLTPIQSTNIPRHQNTKTPKHTCPFSRFHTYSKKHTKAITKSFHNALCYFARKRMIPKRTRINDNFSIIPAQGLLLITFEVVERCTEKRVETMCVLSQSVLDSECSEVYRDHKLSSTTKRTNEIKLKIKSNGL